MPYVTVDCTSISLTDKIDPHSFKAHGGGGRTEMHLQNGNATKRKLYVSCMAVFDSHTHYYTSEGYDMMDYLGQWSQRL